MVLTIGDEKITAADFDRMIEMIPEQYRAQMRTTGRRQFAERMIQFKVMSQQAHPLKLEDTPAFKDQLAFQTEQLLAQQYYQHLQAPPRWTKPPRTSITMSTSRTICRSKRATF